MEGRHTPPGSLKEGKPSSSSSSCMPPLFFSSSSPSTISMQQPHSSVPPFPSLRASSAPLSVKGETSVGAASPKQLSPYESLVYQNMIVFTNNILYYAKKGAAGKMTAQDSLHMKNDMQSLQFAMQLHDEGSALLYPLHSPQETSPPPQPQQTRVMQPIPVAPPPCKSMQPPIQLQVQMQLQTHTHTHTQLHGPMRPSPPNTPPVILEKKQECLCCKTIDTPIWRKGPHGPATLCNACGLKYMRANKKHKKPSITSKKPLTKNVEHNTEQHRSNIYSILN